MSLRLPKCDFCKHLEEGEEYKCRAFPDGIPLAKISDDERVECANGIKFEHVNGKHEKFTPDPNGILAKMHRI